MKIKKISKPMSVVLVTAMICSNFMIASATDDVLINETPLEDTEFTGSETNYNEVEVTYNQASNYSVGIPKTIALNTSKQAFYSVKVTGDIDANECVYVSPVDAIADTDDIDFYMKDENNLKPDVVATVDQNKFYWSSTEVADGYEETNNSISASDLTSGSWKGTFQVEIRLESSHEHDYSNGKCSICGKIDPDHTHTYENGVCTECGEKESGVFEQLEAGLYTTNGIFLCGWEDLGINNDCSNATDIINGCPMEVKMILPDSITTIGSRDGFNKIHAFNGCTKLKSIVIPSSVTSFSADAFKDCTALTDVVIMGNSITNINTNAFYGCTSLENINIPNSVTSISSGAFYGCAFRTIEIPNSVTSIGSNAFCHCKELECIVIPNSVNNIGNQAFGQCVSLTKINIPDSVSGISKSIFQGCKSLTEINIPNSINSIGDCAFQDCTSLTEINIPNSINSIGDHIFQGCTSLTTIDIPNSVNSIGSQTFYCCTSLENINIPDSVTVIGQKAFYNVPHITYHGTATGSPWGALSIN